MPIACPREHLAAAPDHPVRVVLVDDHAVVRAGFRALIERESDLTVVAECGSAAEATALLSAFEIDVMVLDITMRGSNGFDLLGRLAGRRPSTPGVLVMSMHDSEAHVCEAMQRGALGFVTKAAAPEELVNGIRSVALGQFFFSSDLAAPRPTENALGSLTPRELEVFHLLVRGLLPKQAAAELGINIKTAYVHRARLLEKLGVRNDRELYRLALVAGVVPPA